jgi:positive regulator of sigma E activity
MKASIPDTGTVIRLEGGNAVISMKADSSCRKCGAAAMGLCKGGLMQVLTVKNSKRARIGDAVQIGLIRRTQYQGYVLAYVVPAVALVFGAAGGHFLGAYAGFPALEVIAAFAVLIAASFFSLRRLKRLDAVSAIEIVRVLSDPWNPGFPGSDEESLTDHATSVC